MVLQASNLILVTSHAIWTGQGNGLNEAEWLIASFQKQETPTFIEHIKAGLSELSSTPESLLVFSGGPTKPETEVSEGLSYARLAKLHFYWDILSSPQLEARIITEQRALDSFHNVLFSLTKFYEVTGRFPEHMTIISHEFKRARFLELHCKALRWPLNKVTFLGIDPDYMLEDVERATEVREGERRNGFQAWEKDLYGTGEELEGKRERRNPWKVGQGLFETEEARSRCKIDTIVVGQREILGSGPFPWE